MSELVAQITPENRYPEITMGPPRGKELLAILETLEPLNEEFPEIEDLPSEPLPEIE